MNNARRFHGLTKAKETRLLTAWNISVFALFFATILFYYKSLIGEPVWDDHAILSGQAIGGGALSGVLGNNFLGAYFRPLTSLSYLIDQKIFLHIPFFSHQTNVLVHLANIGLLLVLLRKLEYDRLQAFCGAVFFAFCPAMVGAVAWIGGRTDALSVTFLLTFGLVLLTAVRKPSKGWEWFAALPFLAAVLTKEQNGLAAFLAPAAYVWLGKESPKAAIKRSVPIAIALLGFIVIWVERSASTNVGVWPGLSNWLNEIAKTAYHYSMFLTIPNDSGYASLSLWNYQSTLVVMIGALILCSPLIFFKYLKRAPPTIKWMLLGFGLLYLPVSNILPVPSLRVAPYRPAEADALLSALMGCAFGWALMRRQLVVILLGVGHLALCLAVGSRAISAWRSDKSWFTYVLRHDPQSTIARCAYAPIIDLDQRLGFIDDTLDLFLGSDSWRSLQPGLITPTPALERRMILDGGAGQTGSFVLGLLEGYRGEGLLELKKETDALAWLRASAALMKQSPSVFQEAAFIYFQERHYLISLRWYEMEQAISPMEPASFDGIGLCQMALGRAGSSISNFRSAISLAPWSPTYYVHLADALTTVGRRMEAFAILREGRSKAIVTEPIDAEIRKLESRIPVGRADLKPK